MLDSANEVVRSMLGPLFPCRLTRYDLLLWTIPLAFLLALVAATVLSTRTTASLAAASLVAALALFDGLFRNPPTTGAGH